ncbi:MAG TPA: CBS domain-containing protein [Bryobacteraceae bacterium]|nr:CBS domain-containing protein [Bryobacteraceae bacterium]
MKVREVMTKETAFCGLDTSLAEATQLMSKRGCGFLPVVGEGGNVIGAITDRDISIALGTRNRKPSEVLVRDVMLPKEFTFPKLFTCTPEDDVHCVLKTMRKERIRRLPVVDREGALRGIVSIDDLALRASPLAGQRGISCKDVVEAYQAISRRPGPRQAAA